ncbi:MAG: Fe-S protein assembly co-chaperone HscB [Acidobacteria bacterium]|uniref:Fe-S protein assembly co-chaperone HscB n=1 Tax=Candidatus Tanganyikabacteria bacterium TaxID=2961651 RepID=A0A937X790_9BACT|nr:Fe-S protein assembly co-chaperone HscB [Candidatus Tanganyikabacteria bacterium]MBM3774328.1 Fe-S protein assembly co-chaperone HscB [Acidobacteriota bacterium]
MKNYETFGLEPRLSLEPADLERRFYRLSRKLHPDVAGSQSMEAAANLNDAYRTLKDPVSRAEYFLGQRGIEIGEANLPPEMLEEVFELNLALEEGRVEEAAASFAAMLAGIDRELQQKFEIHDAAGDPAALEAIRALLNRRKYVRNLARQAERETVEG